ncbi:MULTISPECIES: hypothetical protein [unclassified Pseudomonas]|uniref:hypothetical protein n=1 Tax=unclassified Pseudomonas TaxID=196821 RepID=UPI00087604AB|nr:MULTISPECIES: hypothetical protein [unclassified Pseudomonas]SCZ74177.1 hypothetical protein SAMN03159460_04551 [Pseudomonas sp. NFPP17]SDA81429.1 hypothetical protein SAMN03159464_04732 [Pseudomonas sp. NFPP15]SEL78854.1 hypothetical protein SAMN03159324_05232 [Pseudomonas sp. NFPP18]SFA66757.1 hypothetical protein SAMN03159320_05050 [Pseudomonas sp. NFPP13]SFU07720.1 hypothetical protein SAMN03159492_05380 [Pseudomonas sp. NFPP25]
MSNPMGDGSTGFQPNIGADDTLKMERRKRARNILVITPLILAISLVVSAGIKKDYYLGFIPVPQSLMYIFAFVLSLWVLGFSILAYLQNGFSLSPKVISFVGEIAGLGLKSTLGIDLHDGREERLNKLEESVDHLKRNLPLMSSADHKKIVADAVSSLKASAGKELLEELSKAASKKADQERKLQVIEREFAQSRIRLMDEVSALGLRGNVNLTLGFLTTVTGLGVLSYFVWQTAGMQQDMISFAISFIPRLSLVVFIQMFAFFFLRLYKAGLLEVKYFQNEITNLELKYFGISTALLAESADSLTEVARNLVESERNKVLQPGQTTFELERSKLEQNTASEVLKVLPRILGRRTG